MTPGDSLLAALGWREPRPARVLAFFAHPDDETLALGGHLADFSRAFIVHATDGAPRDLRDAHALGFDTAESYAAARRGELEAALWLAGVRPEQLACLDVADQQASRNLAPLSRAFAEIVAKRRPDLLFTHAYEGGHPDHDAVAFAARAGARLAGVPLRLVEAPLYHGENGAFVRQRFGPAARALRVELPPERQALKRRMLDCFTSQRATLEPFGCESESFRLGPLCDFSRLPNGGEILYESFDWGCKGVDFLAFTRVALTSLGLAPWL